MAIRTTLTIWYSLAAAWPLAFFAALLSYSVLNPPGNLPEPLAFFAEWSWRLMLAASIVLVLASPFIARRLRTSGRRVGVGFWVAVGSLCISTLVQALCEFVLFEPIA
jgi:hypothetical protein